MSSQSILFASRRTLSTVGSTSFFGFLKKSFEEIQLVPCSNQAIDKRHVATKSCPSECSDWLGITANSICLTLPMSLLTIALVVYVFKYRVGSGDDGLSLFAHPPTVPNDDAIYVQIDSAKLVFLASWMSSVAPLLTGFAITLATYPIAQQLYEDTKNPSRASHLPTSFQLFLMLKLINGSTWGGLWAFFQYCVGWKNRADRRATALAALSLATAITVLLSILVFAADTWLHLATQTVSLTQTTAISVDNILHSFAPLSSCMMTNNSFAALQEANISCTISTFNDTPTVVNPVLTAETISNQSRSRNVLYDISTDLSYLNPSFDTLDSTFDFVASRYAVRTSCKSISKICNLANNGNVTFNCSNGAFEAGGDTLESLGFARQVFKLPDISDMEDATQSYGVLNPFYVAAAAMVPAPSDSPLFDDPGLVPLSAGVSGVFSCSVTVFDVRYAYSQGRVYDLSVAQSNTSITNMFVSAISSLPFGDENNMAALNLAATTAKTAQDFANQLGATLSNTILSSVAGSVQLVPVHLAQQRTPLLVSRVPKRPFCLLISINVAFILLGLLLVVLAAMTSTEGRQAQYRLTIAGIVANLFDRESARKESNTIEQLFGEYHGNGDPVRVGIDRTSKGGFAWSTVGLSSSEVEVREVPVAHLDDRYSSVNFLSPYGSHHELSESRNETSLRKHDRWSWMY